MAHYNLSDGSEASRDVFDLPLGQVGDAQGD